MPQAIHFRSDCPLVNFTWRLQLICAIVVDSIGPVQDCATVVGGHISMHAATDFNTTDHFWQLGHLLPEDCSCLPALPPALSIQTHNPLCQLYTKMLAVYLTADTHLHTSDNTFERVGQLLEDAHFMTTAPCIFVHLEDYAAMLIVLSTFSDIGLTITLCTSTVVMVVHMQCLHTEHAQKTLPLFMHKKDSDDSEFEECSVGRQGTDMGSGDKKEMLPKGVSLWTWNGQWFLKESLKTVTLSSSDMLSFEPHFVGGKFTSSFFLVIDGPHTGR
ncbi:hypothetical protein B0H10DRAFT_1949427 [Mycena sp. CBHHK59/15]|nr:hypothetical protein B0H10DRAFT_1949427 [Mycena sp. CBHHK59/15]